MARAYCGSGRGRDARVQLRIVRDKPGAARATAAAGHRYRAKWGRCAAAGPPSGAFDIDIDLANDIDLDLDLEPPGFRPSPFHHKLHFLVAIAHSRCVYGTFRGASATEWPNRDENETNVMRLTTFGDEIARPDRPKRWLAPYKASALSRSPSPVIRVEPARTFGPFIGRRWGADDGLRHVAFAAHHCVSAVQKRGEINSCRQR
jgi:hypothetical protein